MFPPKHPIWSILRTAVIMGGLALVLSQTSTQFDSGEAKAVGSMGVVSIVYDILKRHFAGTDNG